MKSYYPKNLPLVKLPQKIEFTLFLIREELKSRKFTNELEKVGFDVTICSSDFSPLIFSAIGFDNQSDDFYAWYVNQLDAFCKNIDLFEGATLSEEAFDFYVHLMIEKRNQEESN